MVAVMSTRSEDLARSEGRKLNVWTGLTVATRIRRSEDRGLGMEHSAWCRVSSSAREDIIRMSAQVDLSRRLSVEAGALPPEQED